MNWLMKKTGCPKSRETVPLKGTESWDFLYLFYEKGTPKPYSTSFTPSNFYEFGFGFTKIQIGQFRFTTYLCFIKLKVTCYKRRKMSTLKHRKCSLYAFWITESANCPCFETRKKGWNSPISLCNCKIRQIMISKIHVS